MNNFRFFEVYLFLRERASTSRGGAERKGDRERERIPSRLCAVSAEANVGLEPPNPKIMA